MIAAFKVKLAWAIIVPAVVLNAILQALLVLGNPVGGWSLAPIVLAVLSFLILVKALDLVILAALQAAAGAVDFRGVILIRWRQYGRLLFWALGLLIVVAAGLTLYVVPGLIVLAITPYLLIAVVDGESSPIKANFRAIGSRPGRWLITTIAMGAIAWLLWVLAVANTFFITGAPASFIAWLAFGFIASWFTFTWVLIWRGANPK